MKKKYPRMPVTITPDHVTMEDRFTLTEIKYLMNLMMGDYHAKHSRLYAKLERMLEAYEQTVILVAQELQKCSLYRL